MISVFNKLARYGPPGNRALLVIGVLCVHGGAFESAAQFTSYAARTEFLLTPPGVHPGGLSGFVNPATLALLPAPEASATFASAGDRRAVRSDWGWFAALPHIGAGVLHRRGPGLANLSEARLVVGLGGDDLAVGIGRGWSSARGQTPPGLWIAGVVYRPSPQLSLASTLTQATGGKGREVAADVGYRPWADERLTLFGEGARSSDAAGDERFWSFGADLLAMEGVHVSGRFLDGHSISLGLRLELGKLGLRSQAREVSRNSGTRRLMALRIGPHRGDALTRVRKPVYVDLPLTGPIRHRSYRLLDEGLSHLDLLEDLDRVREDPRIMGIALDLSGLRIDPALSWELRQALLEVRASGRKIIVYIDRAGLRKYHLASVANRIVLDPYGLVGLEGLVAGRMYLANALERLGIGTQQWRTGEFKSAFEEFTRQDMSAADRQQLTALLQDAYADIRQDVAKSRNLSEDTFDFLVDGAGVLTAEEALTEGLVDTLARWPAVDAMLRAEGAHSAIDRWQVARPVDCVWGHTPTIAIAYALGVCDLDTGIRARSLSQQLNHLATDKSVDAVVLRVDSPGGDVLASDWVSEAVAEVAKHKPVIISHGRLAASGGYWISMEGDVIVTSPHTITGSIGVIGGWLYDDGLKERLGVQTDHVQVGAHADLGFGAPLPLLGVTLPDRPLDQEEAAHVEAAIESTYERFIARVADSRELSIAHVDSVAQGRVWSGSAAIEQGLADTLGTLSTAIEIARERAGLNPDRPLRLIELPDRRWVAPRSTVLPFGLLSGWFAPELAGHRPGSLRSWVDFRTRHNGEAMPMLPDTFIDDSQGLVQTGVTDHE
jgi:protease-4